jgi:hypothetical protein
MSAFTETSRLEARIAELETELESVTADRDDYAQRWLAECRAHGDTQRRLTAAHHELGEHSLCSTADCSDACACETGNAYLCLRCERIAEDQDIGF